MKQLFKFFLFSIAITLSFLAADSVSANSEPSTYCNDNTCYVWEDPENDGSFGWYPTTPTDPEPPTYCDVNSCYVYQCSSPGNCSWSQDNSYTSASVCTLTGCYVFVCSGVGMERNCSWDFKERSPVDRTFFIEK